MSAPSDIQKILDRLSGNAPLPSQQHPQYGYGYKGFESPAVPPPPIPEVRQLQPPRDIRSRFLLDMSHVL